MSKVLGSLTGVELNQRTGCYNYCYCDCYCNYCRRSGQVQQPWPVKRPVNAATHNSAKRHRTGQNHFFHPVKSVADVAEENRIRLWLRSDKFDGVKCPYC